MGGGVAPATAFVVQVPEAEALVGDLRARFDAYCDGLSLLENAGGHWPEMRRRVLPSQGAVAR